MGIWNNLLKSFSKDMGIDLGTANTVVYVRGEGIVVREPSVVAIDKTTRQVMAIGNEAYSMVGRTPGNIIAVRPMKDGVIADFDITEKMIREFVKKAILGSRISRPRVLIGVPWGITDVEKRAVLEASANAGAKETFLIDEPMAAAVGAGIQVENPTGQMIVDIGGGTTEVAVISLGGIVTCKSIRIAGNELDEAIMAHCRKNYNLLIGERMAEKIKLEIGSAYPFEEEPSHEVRGRDLLSGLPRIFTLSSYEIRDALAEPVAAIVDTVKMTLERTPPELSSDIMERGIVMAGGGALLNGLVKYLSEETGLKIRRAEDPLSCVAIGTGRILESEELMDCIASSITSKR
ncbi:rod shape-determining protein [bacterium]|nr:rod shape-determining protein [bacterium]